MLELLTGPIGLLAVVALWILLQAVILPRLGVGT
jgi:hypothetical protein